MEVYFTRHARNRMRLYDVTEQMVRAALEQPERITEAALGSRHAWIRMGEYRWLRVTFKDEGNRRVVITATPKDRGPGG